MTNESETLERRIEAAERALIDAETLAVLLHDLISQLRGETALLREVTDGGREG